MVASVGGVSADQPAWRDEDDDDIRSVSMYRTHALKIVNSLV